MPQTVSGYTFDHLQPKQDVAVAAASIPSMMLVDIVDSLFGKSVIAVQPIAKGQQIFPFAGKLVSKPSMHTLQVDDGVHLTCEGGPEFTAHSCDPNAYFEFGTASGQVQAVLLALRDIAVGEHISFNYNSTEWDMAAPFSCLCGAPNCIGQIRGFKYLTTQQRALLTGQLSPYIGKKAADLQPVSPLIDIVDTHMGRSIVATQDLPAGAVLFSLTGETRTRPDKFTVQVEEHLHVLARGGAELTNHSCSPNAYFRVDAEATAAAGHTVLQLVSLLALREREHITFHYCSTEWDMAEKFHCRCGSDNCLGLVQGFLHLTPEQRATLEPMLTPFIRNRARAAGLLPSNSGSPVVPAATASPADSERSDSPLSTNSPATPIMDASVAANTAAVRAINSNVVIGTNRYGRSLQAAVDLRAGQLIYSCTGSLQSTPDKFTVQLDERSHLLVSGSAELTNHSCDPNGYFHVFADHLELFALRDIAAGEDLTFHYCTTEWDMAEKFRCGCGSPQCFGWIQGYRHVTPEQAALLPDQALSPFILRKRAAMRPINDAVDICEHSEVGRSLVAARELAAGVVIFSCSGPTTEMLDRPDKFTVQVDAHRHVNCHGSAELMNHSCDPNAYFILHNDTLVAVARRTVHVGEPITFHYASTEWDMAEPFRCQCGAGGDVCMGLVRGFKFLNSRQRRALLEADPPLGVLPYIKERVASLGLIDVDSEEYRLRAEAFAHSLGPRVTLTDKEYGRAAVAAEFIPAGTAVYAFAGEILDHPTMHTVQLDESRHINTHGGPEYTSHSCSPNAYFRFEGDDVALVTLRDVLEGEELSFHYCSTEWDMAEPFRCQCGSARCQGLVQGYRHLTHEQRVFMEPMISPFIRAKRDEELGLSSASVGRN